MTRTDLHRPSQMIPADYEFLTAYAPPRFDCDGECVDEGYGQEESNAEVESATDEGRAVVGDFGRCGTCGARYNVGALFRYVPTGDLLHVGHQCARSMMLLADFSAAELAANRGLEAVKTAALRKVNATKRAAFLDRFPGLREALATDHAIVEDIASRFQRYCEISDRQVELVFKIARDVAVRDAEPVVPAPEGRVVVEGEVVSVKCHEGFYGTTLKMTVKVEAEGGSWLCWGTVPAAIDMVERGARVRFTGTLERIEGKAHFATFKRPSKAEVVEAKAELGVPAFVDQMLAIGSRQNEAAFLADNGEG